METMIKWRGGASGMIQILRELRHQDILGGAYKENKMKTSSIINGIEVDLRSVYSINHLCRNGVCNSRTCCCANYEVCVDSGELSAIIECLDEASKFAPHLKSGDGFDNVFDQIGTDLFCIDTNDEGLCVFAYDLEERIFCSLHSAAISLGIPPSAIKPKVCALWPLSRAEEKPVILSIDEDAFSFKCNKLKNCAMIDYAHLSQISLRPPLERNFLNY